MTSAARERWRFWLQRAGWGVVLGMVITAMEFAYYAPLVADPDRFGLASLLALLMAWCGEAVLLLLAVGAIERAVMPREARAWQLAIGVLAGAVLGVLVWQAFLQHVVRDRWGIPLSRDHIGVPLDWTAGVLYHAWMILFFGGLAVAVHASDRRRTRMLATLRMAEMDRAMSQRRLAALRLDALRSRVDPDFMLVTLARIERLYDAEPEAAERTLEGLIAHLRGALAELRATLGNADPLPAAAAAGPGLGVAPSPPPSFNPSRRDA